MKSDGIKLNDYNKKMRSDYIKTKCDFKKYKVIISYQTDQVVYEALFTISKKNKFNVQLNKIIRNLTIIYPNKTDYTKSKLIIPIQN